MPPRVVDESVFAQLSPPLLAGSRCPGCGAATFPRQRACPRCGSGMEPVALPARGTLWTWTVQMFPPKAPYRPPAGGFSPFAVGYVDLGDVLVESRLSVPDAGVLRVGLPMRLALAPAWHADDGTDPATFVFVPDTQPGPALGGETPQNASGTVEAGR